MSYELNPELHSQQYIPTTLKGMISSKLWQNMSFRVTLNIVTMRGFF